MDVSEVKLLARRANGILFVLPFFILFFGFGLVYSILVLKNEIEPDRDILFTIYLFSCCLSRQSRRMGISYFKDAWEYRFCYDMQIDKELAAETRFGHLYEESIFNIDPFDFILWECIISYSLYLIIILSLFLDRLLTPRTIMEYDDYGLYIYRTGEPVKLLRYKELWSTYAEEDLEELEFCYRRGFYRCRNIRISNPFWGLFKTGSIRIEVPDGFINLSGIYHVKEVEREIKRMVRKHRKEFIAEMEEKTEENRRQRELEELTRHNPDT